MPDTVPRRLFFALWPSSTDRELIAKRADILLTRGEKCVSPDNFHMTLAFLGGCSPAVEETLVRDAGEVRVDSFRFDLVQIGYWGKPRILWCGPEQVPAAQLDLVQQLRTVMTKAGLAPETRRYQPHITLARKLVRWDGPESMPAIHWQAHDFCLVHSSSAPVGVRYEVIHRWPLT